MTEGHNPRVRSGRFNLAVLGETIIETGGDGIELNRRDHLH
jgi:hypothetical protein